MVTRQDACAWDPNEAGLNNSNPAESEIDDDSSVTATTVDPSLEGIFATISCVATPVSTIVSIA